MLSEQNIQYLVVPSWEKFDFSQHKNPMLFADFWEVQFRKKLHSNEPRDPKIPLKKIKLPVKTLSATQFYFEIFLRADGQHNLRKDLNHPLKH